MQVKDVLTERELELVKLAALGMRNRHIAWRLGIAEDTVKHWFVTIFDKSGAWSRLELVMRWVREQANDSTATHRTQVPSLRPAYPTSSPQFSSVFFTKAMN